jgi:hypothetical protein
MDQTIQKGLNQSVSEFLSIHLTAEVKPEDYPICHAEGEEGLKKFPEFTSSLGLLEFLN